MPSKKHFDPMHSIATAIRMFMEEEPEDALVVLHDAQQMHFDYIQVIRREELVEEVTEELKTASAKHDPMQAWLVTNNIHHAKAYPERAECEAAVQELRNETGWDWTFQSIEDETGDCWHHMPCILNGGARVYLFPR